MLKTFLVAACLALLLPVAASGNDDGTDTSFTILKDAQRYVVQHDGSYALTEEYLIQLNEQRGAEEAGHPTYSFNRTLETLEVLEAYNEKPDGRRIMVRPEQVLLQREPQSGPVPVFEDMQVKSFAFSEVAQGDKLYAKVRRTRLSPMFPGQFYDAVYPTAHPTRELSVSYDLPADMPLHAHIDGFTPTPASTRDGRTVYSWTYAQSGIARNEIDSVDYADFGHHLLVSTFDTYAQLGLAYDKRSAEAAVPGDRIKAEVATLLRGLDTPRAKALAIANWVRTNIRYVENWIGNDGWIPHSADSIFDRRYGDCKDHATLMEAMLSVAAIDSTPVLINSGDSYKLAPVVVSSFNHAITYVPGLDLYLDSTAADFEAGELPPSELDKPVVLTRTGQIGHTPIRQLMQAKARLNMRFATDGSIVFRQDLEFDGWAADVTRRIQRQLAESQRTTFVESLLKGLWVKGTGSFETGDLENPGPVYAFDIRGTADDWADLPGTVGLATESNLNSNASVKTVVLGLSAEAVRTQPYVCPDIDLTEDATFEFPAAATVLARPGDVHIDSPYLHYSAEYRPEARALLVRRHFQIGKANSRVCTPEDFRAMQPDIQKMVRDVRSQFILQLPEPRGT